MSMFNSLNKVAMTASASMLALVAVTGGVGLYEQNKLTDELHNAERTAELLRSHLTADMMHDAMRSDVLAALTARDPASGITMAEVRADFAEHMAEFRAMIAEEGELAETDSERAAVAGVAEPLNAYITAAERVINEAESNPQAALAQLPGFFEQFRALEGAMEEVTNVISASAEEAKSQAERDSAIAFWLLIATLVFATGAVAALAIGARRYLVSPLLNLTTQMDQLAKGDNSINPPEAARGDEIGAMGRALLTFRQAALDRIEAERRHEESRIAAAAAQKEAEARAQREAEELVVGSFGEGLAKLADGDLTYRLNRQLPEAYLKLQDDFNNALAKLEDAMQTIASNADGIRSGTGEISTASDGLSRRTEQQAATLEETAAALDEITATVGKTAEGARQANATVQHAREHADKSGEIVRDAVSAMEAIEGSSKQISQIIGVIDEIAFQTNLLALNAGVEAARAGEAGRGFAVVASEVRALAQRSAEAAKEIKALISTSTQQVGAGVKLVGQAGQALSEIAAGVAEINALMADITASAQEQATALTQVNSAVNQMDQTTQQNAAMVEESTAASHALAHEAEQLAQLVARFEVSRATRAVAAPRAPTRATPSVTTRPAPAPRATPKPVSAETPAPKRANPVLQQQERLAEFAAAKPARRVAMPSSTPTKVESWEEF
ncbi:methyl-accepting chemotaxis protein [Vitreimonas flagellata]|uniref:methyl-accepting chemotaxis protein n=1 Tax=Vitreimonas flagellata TaxID=2560861 RepID=UPI001EF7A85B|nr:methyl-accepting chemotaxis protein [Vitreimonas flagellata]